MHPFQKMYQNTPLSARLTSFYDKGEWERYQHRYLDDTEYMPSAMYVDFVVIGMLENPDFTGETIGEQYIEFANLISDLESDPEGYECYAHLAIDPQTTRVYLMEPSGDPELIGDNIDVFLKRLKTAGDDAGGKAAR